MNKRILFLGLVWALAVAPQAGTAQSRSLVEEMQQRMLQMQQRMMQGLQGFDDMQDSSGLYFHFDTTFSGGGAHFFQFSPPGDSMGGASGLEDFFRGMFDFDMPFGSGEQSFPKDDGQLPHPDDEMLPEERLRQEEQAPAAGQKSTTPPPPDKKKPRVESIRI